MMSAERKRGIYEKYGKRMLDLLCSAVFLLLFWWLYLVIGLLVRIKLGSPVLFKQERPGKDGKLFCLYKFRTMTDERGADGRLLPDEKRLTGFGKWLRSTSLDELPELFHILKGEMSLVGPRPLLVEYLELYSEEQRRRHEVRPGLTGLAQVRGRNALGWEERFLLDTEYVEHVSFILDVQILAETVKKVIKREGISSETSVTMEPFLGKEEIEAERKK